MVKIRHMANTFRKIYKKTGNSGSSSDYSLVGNVGVDGVELDIMKGASSSSNGEIGLVPKPTSGQENYILTGRAAFRSIDDVLVDSDVLDSILNPDLIVDSGTINTSPTMSFSANYLSYKYLLMMVRRFSSPIQTQIIPVSVFQSMVGASSSRIIFYIYTGSGGYDTIEVRPGSSSTIRITCSTIDGNYIFNTYGIGK